MSNILNPALRYLLIINSKGVIFDCKLLGYWSLVQRVTGPTVVVADVGTVSKRVDKNSCINSVLVRDFVVSLNLRKHSAKKSTLQKQISNVN